MTDINKELADILTDMAEDYFPYHEYGNEKPYIDDNKIAVNEAIAKIKALVVESLPKEKQKTFQGTMHKSTIEYAHISGIKDGYNQCLGEIRSIYEGK